MLYEVKLTAVCVVAIEAESAEEALGRATAETDMDDYEFVEGGPAEEIKNPDYQEAVKRHANIVIGA